MAPPPPPSAPPPPPPSAPPPPPRSACHSMVTLPGPTPASTSCRSAPLPPSLPPLSTQPPPPPLPPLPMAVPAMRAAARSCASAAACAGRRTRFSSDLTPELTSLVSLRSRPLPRRSRCAMADGVDSSALPATSAALENALEDPLTSALAAPAAPTASAASAASALDDEPAEVVDDEIEIESDIEVVYSEDDAW
mmetsp:Transcript_8706/g.21577  ORF Transcript_8706/g.21577 Transcript_8706/m.21577 type:complete len:194 (-) Transcript_8706:35-616(-)